MSGHHQEEEDDALEVLRQAVDRTLYNASAATIDLLQEVSATISSLVADYAPSLTSLDSRVYLEVFILFLAFLASVATIIFIFMYYVLNRGRLSHVQCESSSCLCCGRWRSAILVSTEVRPSDPDEVKDVIRAFLCERIGMLHQTHVAEMQRIAEVEAAGLDDSHLSMSETLRAMIMRNERDLASNNQSLQSMGRQIDNAAKRVSMRTMAKKLDIPQQQLQNEVGPNRMNWYLLPEDQAVVHEPVSTLHMNGRDVAGPSQQPQVGQPDGSKVRLLVSPVVRPAFSRLSSVLEETTETEDEAASGIKGGSVSAVLDTMTLRLRQTPPIREEDESWIVDDSSSESD